jgi:hypothetical protein
MRSSARLGVAAAAAFGLLATGAVGAAQATTVTFLPTGNEQTFTVPAGVTSISVAAVGGRGGVGVNGNATTGFGALAAADTPVNPGEVLYVEVGGNGVSGGTASFNGGGAGGNSSGGGGGGASDVRTAPRSAGSSLGTRLIIAAGGGGSGGGDPSSSGAGGNAGSAGGGGFGGAGQPATAIAPGAAAGSGACASEPGVLGSGGRGGSGGCVGSGSGGGGGGGGGIYGGGGGGGSSAGGGGGGGSSGFAASATNTSVALDSTGSPSISITYAGSPPSTGGGGSGGGTGGGSSTPALTKATISAVKQTNSVFAVGRASTPLTGRTAARAKTGTTFSFVLDQPSTAKLAITTTATGRRVGRRCRRNTRSLRRKPRCKRTVKVATLTRATHAGLNKVAFTGRIRGRALKPGRYKLALTATTAAGTSAARTLRFRIVRR